MALYAQLRTMNFPAGDGGFYRLLVEYLWVQSVWNCLPLEIRLIPTFDSSLFYRLLKTFCIIVIELRVDFLKGAVEILEMKE